MAGIILTETDTAASHAYTSADGCTPGGTDSTTTSAKQATAGGTAGTTPVALTLNQLNVTNLCIQFESAANEPNSTAMESGTWTVRVEVTTSDKLCTLWSATACRRNSSGVAQESLSNQASGVGDWTTTGVKTATLTGTASTGAVATDRISVNIGVFNSSTMASATPAYKPSQNIDTPVTQNGGAVEDMAWNDPQPHGAFAFAVRTIAYMKRLERIAAATRQMPRFA